MFLRFIQQRYCCSQTTNSKPVYRIRSIFEDAPINKEICVNGWVKAIRRMKSATFLDVSDGTTPHKLQVILPKNHSLSSVSFHSGVSVTGQLKESKHPSQPFELHADDLQVLGRVEDDPPYPFAAKHRYTPDQVREFQSVRCRTNTFGATMRIRARVRSSLCTHLEDSGYLQVDAPVLTSNDCEGGSDAFRVMTTEDLKTTNEKQRSYFKKPVNLTVSAQMHLEALANGLSAVYCLNPAFRAEASYGRNHLAEFWMLEAEEAFLQGEQGLTSLMYRVENLVKDAIKKTIEKSEDDLKIHWKEHSKQEIIVQSALTKPFARLTYDEALSLLSSHTNTSHGQDLNKQDELKLTELCGSVPVFVTHAPTDLAPFYMACSTQFNNRVLSMDLLLPGVGETVGGSVREQCPEALARKAPQSSHELLDWYIGLRRWGGVPSAGYGLGFERLLLFMMGVQNIKDVIAFPRAIEHCMY